MKNKVITQKIEELKKELIEKFGFKENDLIFQTMMNIIKTEMSVLVIEFSNEIKNEFQPCLDRNGDFEKCHHDDAVIPMNRINKVLNRYTF